MSSYFSTDLISVLRNCVCAHLNHPYTLRYFVVMMIETNFKSISRPLILNSHRAAFFFLLWNINCPQMQSIYHYRVVPMVVEFIYFFLLLFVSSIHRIRFSHFVVINELTRFLLITCAYGWFFFILIQNVFFFKFRRSQNKLKINL